MIYIGQCVTMGDLLLLLLLTLSLPSSAAVPSSSLIFMDASSCVHLRCEWQGVGKQCKSATTLQKDRSGHFFEFLKDDESDDDLLTRIKGHHPLNTFTIVNNVELGEMCKERRLWCNAAQLFFIGKGYMEFFERLLDPRIPLALRPKLRC